MTSVVTYGWSWAVCRSSTPHGHGEGTGWAGSARGPTPPARSGCSPADVPSSSPRPAVSRSLPARVRIPDGYSPRTTRSKTISKLWWLKVHLNWAKASLWWFKDFIFKSVRDSYVNGRPLWIIHTNGSFILVPKAKATSLPDVFIENPI